MSTVIITGSSGFLGRYLLKLSPSQSEIFAVYRRHKPENYGKNIHLIRQDLLSDRWINLDKLAADVIVHTAAMANIDDCETHPEVAQQMNFKITCRLVKYAAQNRARFIFVSSDVVFDGKRGDYKEHDKPNPLNVYARTKVEAENYVLSHHDKSVVVRPSIFYGRSLNGRPSFIETMLNNLRAGNQVTVFTDQYRTPLFVENLADALWELVNHRYCGILHIGGPEKLNRVEIGKILCRELNLDENLLELLPSQAANLIAKRPLDCALISNLAGSLLKTKFVDCRTGLRMSFR
jgi:dTDP-4-dehydrorhamnose reductase